MLLLLLLLLLLLGIIIRLLLLLSRRVPLLRPVPSKGVRTRRSCSCAPGRVGPTARDPCGGRLMGWCRGWQGRGPVLIPRRQGLVRSAPRGRAVDALTRSRTSRDATLSVLLPTPLRRVRSRGLLLLLLLLLSVLRISPVITLLLSGFVTPCTGRGSRGGLNGWRSTDVSRCGREGRIVVVRCGSFVLLIYRPARGRTRIRRRRETRSTTRRRRRQQRGDERVGGQ